jgi:hypothetical protein
MKKYIWKTFSAVILDNYIIIIANKNNKCKKKYNKHKKNNKHNKYNKNNNKHR